MILLTGASGFVGRHLLRHLTERFGAESVVALTSRPLPGVTCILHEDYTFAPDAFVDAGLHAIHTLIHAGAFTPKNRHQANDPAASTRNVETTLHLLRAQLPNLRQVIYLSTVDVYTPGARLDESTPPAPQTLYGWSKLYGEKLVEAWARDTGRASKVLRIGHVYGPGEEAYDKVIPASFRRIRAGEALQLHGSGAEERSFIYVNDVVEAITRAIPVDLDGPLNVVGDTPISMRALLTTLLEVTGHSAPLQHVSPDFIGRDFTFAPARLAALLPRQTPLAVGLAAEWQSLSAPARD